MSPFFFVKSLDSRGNDYVDSLQGRELKQQLVITVEDLRDLAMGFYIGIKFAGAYVLHIYERYIRSNYIPVWDETDGESTGKWVERNGVGWWVQTPQWMILVRSSIKFVRNAIIYPEVVLLRALGHYLQGLITGEYDWRSILPAEVINFHELKHQTKDQEHGND